MTNDQQYELGEQVETTDPPDVLDRSQRTSVRRAFDEWCSLRLARFGVTWKTYRERRLAGTWNEMAERLFPGRDEFKIEEE